MRRTLAFILAGIFFRYVSSWNGRDICLHPELDTIDSARNVDNSRHESWSLVTESCPADNNTAVILKFLSRSQSCTSNNGMCSTAPSAEISVTDEDRSKKTIDACTFLGDMTCFIYASREKLAIAIERSGCSVAYSRVIQPIFPMTITYQLCSYSANFQMQYIYLGAKLSEATPSTSKQEASSPVPTSGTNFRNFPVSSSATSELPTTAASKRSPTENQPQTNMNFVNRILVIVFGVLFAITLLALIIVVVRFSRSYRHSTRASRRDETELATQVPTSNMPEVNSEREEVINQLYEMT